MGERFLHELFTPEVLRAQHTAYGRQGARPPRREGEGLGPDEQAFLSERDSFYLATVTSEGWPYVQHRGGPKGFLRALDPRTLAFADLKGNRQLISTGNLEGGGKVALIAVDYPRRERLKVLGHARLVDPKQDPVLAQKLNAANQRAVERLMVIDVVASDWNCPAYITPRYTVEEVEALAKPLRDRIAELEAERLK